MKCKTKVFRCDGGPFNGQLMRLSEDFPFTLDFNLKQWRGRYRLIGEELAWQSL